MYIHSAQRVGHHGDFPSTVLKCLAYIHSKGVHICDLIFHQNLAPCRLVIILEFVNLNLGYLQRCIAQDVKSSPCIAW